MAGGAVLGKARTMCVRCVCNMRNSLHVPSTKHHTLSKNKSTQINLQSHESYLRMRHCHWRRMIASHSVDSSDIQIPQPEFDWAYLTDPKNTENIRQSIKYRKGVGDIDALVRVVDQIKARLSEFPPSKELEGDSLNLWKVAQSLAADIPNTTHPDSPVGGEEENETVALIGSPEVFSFRPRTVMELGKLLDGLRTENLGHTSGHRGYYFKGDVARLEQALIRYTVDTLTGRGFTLLSVPDMLHPAVIEGCGFKTDGANNQVYRLVAAHGNVCLSGTGEMGLAGYLMNRRFRQEQLPLKLMTLSRCYRAEAGEAQGDMGIYRVHAFTKVEMFALVANERGVESDLLMQEFVDIQKNMFKDLGLHFRILNMSSEELGAPAHRKYDMEAWMPGNKLWGEISSTSNCTDFQSRRLNIKYNDGHQLKHVHTLNGTACAVPRMILALLETGQQQDGSVRLPAVLHPYMGGAGVMRVCERPMRTKWIKLTKTAKKLMKQA